MGKSAIVVVSFNHLIFTKRCINSIIKYTPRDLYKLCLVDNGSGDGTKEWALDLERKGIIDKFISNASNLGACKASNQGTSWALQEEEIDSLVICANDHIVSKNWLVPLRESPFDYCNPFSFFTLPYFRKQDSVVPGLIDRYKPLRLKYLQKDNDENLNKVLFELYGDYDKFVAEFKSRHSNRPYKAFKVVQWHGFIFYRKNIFTTVGMKDEDFLKFDKAAYADVDFSVRVSIAGFKGGIALNSYVHHWGSITTRKNGLRSGPGGYVNRDIDAFKYFTKKWGYTPNQLDMILSKHRK